MRTRAKSGEGRVAQDFASLVLSLLGKDWKIKWLDPVSGFWKRADVYRVEGYVIDPEGRSIAFGCWSTMTSCVRNGMELSFDDSFTIEGFALTKSKKGKAA